MASPSAVQVARPRSRPRAQAESEAWRPSARHAVPVLVVLAVGPALSLGGAPAWAVPLWSSVALLALVATGVDLPVVRRDRLAQAALLLLAVTAFQLLPLPPWLLRFLDPRSADVSAGALHPLRLDRAGAWRPLHLDPGNGWVDAQYFVGLLAAYLAARRATARGYADVLFDGIAAAPLVIACIALAHKGIGLEAVYGLYTPRQAAPPILSPLLNPNHLSALTGAGAIVWTGRAVAARNVPARIVNAIGAVVCGAVCALSLSRGGVAAAVGGLVLFALLVTWVPSIARRSGARRGSTQRLLGAAIVSSVVVAAGLYMAFEALRSEYATGDATKFVFVRASWRPIVQHWLLGSGSGGVNAAISTSAAIDGGMLFPRVENLVADLAIAFGIPVTIAALVLLGRWLWGVRPATVGASPTHAAAFAAVVSLGVHDLLDFALWLGGTGFFAAVLAGWMAGTASNSAAPSGHKPRPTRRAATMVLLAASVAAALVTARSSLVSDQNTAEGMVRNASAVDEAAFARMLVRHPGDPYLPLAGAAVALRNGDARALRFVSRAMTLAPAWAEPHALLAHVLAARGMTAQALLEIRFAAERVGPRHASLAALLVRIAPPPAELERTVPRSAMGLAFLRAVAGAAAGTPYGLEVDALLLRRDPDNLLALVRAALRARELGDRGAEQALYERIARVHPRSPVGYLGLADQRVASRDYAGAEEILHRAVRAGGDPTPFVQRLATVAVLRRDGPAMRRAMQQLLEQAGANVEQRIAVYGEIGAHEVSLGNDALALAAFERADLMAFPAHPYLVQIAQIAARLNDVNRLRGACGQMRDEGPLTAGQREICAPADRMSPAALGAALETGEGRGSAPGGN